MKKLIALFVLLSIATSLASQGIGGRGGVGGKAGFGGGALFSVSDNFDRGNSANLGANWGLCLGAAKGFGISGNLATNENSGIGPDCGYWSANAFTANQYSKVVIAGHIATADQAVVVRSTIVGGASGNAYGCGLRTGLDSTFYTMWKIVAGTLTQIGTTSAVIFRIGNTVELDAVGTTITCKVNGYNIIAPVTDASIASGQIGIRANSSSNLTLFDNWSGGNL